MKKIVAFMAALSLIAVSCTEKEMKVQIPTVSFEQQGQTLPEGFTDVRLMVTGMDQNNPNEYRIDVKCSGTATEQDYELSTDHFIVGGANPVTAITVISKNFSGETKTLTLTLVPQDNVNMGKYTSTTITIDTQQKLIYDFVNEEVEMKAMAKVELMLSDEDYNEYYPDVELHIPAAVDVEQSTAVLGEHFEFIGTPEFFMTPDDDFAVANIRFLKKEEGKDKIVLTVDTQKATRYLPGEIFPTCTVTIIGPDYTKLDGQWYVAEQITDKNYMMKTARLEENDLVGFPVATANDKFTFNTAEGKLTTSLESDLKNFFGAECKMKSVDGMMIPTHDSGGFEEKAVEMIDLTNCNRNFDATKTSQDKNAYIGFRIIEKAGEEVLELNLLDYKSTSFAQAFNGLNIYNPERPTATASGCCLMFILKKVK